MWLRLGRRGAEGLRPGQAEPGSGSRFNMIKFISRKRWKATEEHNAEEKGFAFCSLKKTIPAAVGENKLEEVSSRERQVTQDARAVSR